MTYLVGIIGIVYGCLGELSRLSTFDQTIRGKAIFVNNYSQIEFLFTDKLQYNN